MSLDDKLIDLRKRIPPLWLSGGILLLGISMFTVGVIRGVNYLVVLSAIIVFFGMIINYSGVFTKRAVKAIDSTVRRQGRIYICEYTYDSYPEHFAKIFTGDSFTWDIEFSPIYWSSKKGWFSAELRYIPGVEWPSLLIVENEGVIFPKEIATKNPSHDTFKAYGIKIEEKDTAIGESSSSCDT